MPATEPPHSPALSLPLSHQYQRHRKLSLGWVTEQPLQEKLIPALGATVPLWSSPCQEGQPLPHSSGKHHPLMNGNETGEQKKNTGGLPILSGGLASSGGSMGPSQTRSETGSSLSFLGGYSCTYESVAIHAWVAITHELLSASPRCFLVCCQDRLCNRDGEEAFPGEQPFLLKVAPSHTYTLCAGDADRTGDEC